MTLGFEILNALFSKYIYPFYSARLGPTLDWVPFPTHPKSLHKGGYVDLELR